MKEDFLKLYPGGEKAYKALRKRMDNSIPKGHSQWAYETDTVGMMLYVDLFSGNLQGLFDKVSYFESLGVNLIHLMPLLEPRVGENDGGYAVKNYREVDPRLGNMSTLKALISHYHDHGIRLCIDYVLNHTSDDHQWAIEAKAGNERYQAYYHMFDNPSEVKRLESTLEEVFPKVAPGNFTYLEPLNKWVMTTFYPFQWDLNYKNVNVFLDMVEQLMFFADIGIDMIRLDAIPFIYKKEGTNCKNLSEAHDILRLMRLIIAEYAPGMVLLGEAIMAPDIIKRYFGTHEAPQCHALYHAAYMVEIWNAIATQDARYLEQMDYTEVHPKALWINYARCHDDIGWGLDEAKIIRLGFNPHAHKQFLIDFYLGIIPQSFSAGDLYEFNPQTGDARNCGTLASLSGLEKALGTHDEYAKELALKRIALIHMLVLMKKGLPMLYSGDEIGQLNDYGYLEDPKKAVDSRWLHRCAFRHEHINTLSDATLPWTQVFLSVQKLIRLRKRVYHLTTIASEQAIPSEHLNVLIWHQRLSNGEDVLIVTNLSHDRVKVYTNVLKRYGFRGSWHDAGSGKRLDFEEAEWVMGPYQYFILKK